MTLGDAVLIRNQADISTLNLTQASGLRAGLTMQTVGRCSQASIIPADLFEPEHNNLGVDSVTVAVVIPCYRVKRHILSVLGGIGSKVSRIYVVDDVCPEHCGDFVERFCSDARVRVLRNSMNEGVGGATITGLRQAIADGATIIVKVDGDGQMDLRMLPILVDVIQTGQADYVKGNRFLDPESVAEMPTVRLLGNAGLSFLAKLSTGYWHSFDPTNGYIAIHAEVARRLPLEKISKRYFFESDLLFRLSTIRARVVDIPMPAIYRDEISGLNSARAVLPFAFGHLRNFGKRLAYNYLLRDFSVASVQLLSGAMLLVFGLVYGFVNWGSPTPATAGTVMLSGMSVILGVQLLLAFLAYDVQAAPSCALHPRLRARARRLSSREEATVD